jgi:hypothetical protein
VPNRDSLGRFVSPEPRGGAVGGKDDPLVRSLRRRLEKLLGDKLATSREIGVLTRALVSAQTLALLDRQIALADQKLGRGDKVNLEAITREMTAKRDKLRGRTD